VNANGKYDVTKKGNAFRVLCLDENSSFLHILVEEERHQIVYPPTEFPKFYFFFLNSLNWHLKKQKGETRLIIIIITLVLVLGNGTLWHASFLSSRE